MKLFVFCALIAVAAGKDICKLNKKVGPGRAAIPRWFYNKKTSQCEEFIYGGMRGNKNNFKTKEKCEKRCGKDICKLNKKVGPGRAAIPRWFYNKKTSQCEEFIYGGMRGNKNNFKTKEKCEKRCGKTKVESDDESEGKDICKLDKKVGPGRAAIPRWFYNKKTSQCEEFIYGGMDGNKNNFKTKEKCEERCEKTQAESDDESEGQNRGESEEEGRGLEPMMLPWQQNCADVCSFKKEVGPGRAAFPRWFYNGKTSQCEKFTYGGVGGNGNNFESKDECEERCGQRRGESEEEDEGADVCSFKKEVGPGRAAFPRWFYNKKTSQCEKFTYGGVGGNGNNFESKDECEERCGQRREESEDEGEGADVCSFKKEVGPGRAAFPRWFYNKKTSQCEKFTYGGVGGNGNNFESKDECEERCGQRREESEDEGEGQSKDKEEGERENQGESEEESGDNVCQLDKEVGPGRAGFPRWYFNKETSQCEQFIWGGIGGNKNNFPTKEKCEEKCEEE